MPPVVIRKYENRRLYDTAGSRYVNLEDVARMVREGADVRVVDARSGEDVTRLVLTQIILEEARAGEGSVPLDVLRQMVAAQGGALAEFFRWYSDALRAASRAALPFLPLPAPDPRIAELEATLAQLRQRLDELERRPRRKGRGRG